MADALNGTLHLGVLKNALSPLNCLFFVIALAMPSWTSRVRTSPHCHGEPGDKGDPRDKG